MGNSTLIGGVLHYNKLDDRGIRAVSGALLNNLFLDQPIPPDKFADIVYEDQFALNELPAGPIIKMSKAEHVDAFFREGTLRLGSFSYYNAFDHEEIGDTSEGSFILVGRREAIPTTAIARISGGFNYYVFCCYSGEADDDCIHRFGYDSSFQIKDVPSFATAIQRALNADRYWFSECVYSKDKVVVGRISEDFDFTRISAHLLDLANEAKYFVKPDTYSHQREFRIIWRVPEDVDDFLDIRCPNAIQFCSR